MLKSIIAALLPTLLPLALTGLTAGTVWVAAHLGAFLASKAKTSRAMGALAALNELVMSIVQDIEANEKAELLSASPTGILTAAEGAKLKAIALSRLKADLGSEGLATLQSVLSALLGFSSLNNLLSGKVEQAVSNVPVSAAKVVVGTAPAPSSPK